MNPQPSTTPITAAEIAALRDALSKATPGEWHSYHDSACPSWSPGIVIFGGAPISSVDSIFCVAAHNLAPKLLAALDAAEQRAAATETELATIHRTLGRGDGHGSLHATADCVISGIAALKERVAEAEAEIEKLNRSIAITSNREDNAVRKWLGEQFTFTFAKRRNLSSDGQYHETPEQYVLVEADTAMAALRNALGLTRVAEANAKELREKLDAAEAEINRLQAGGCARDQRTTQYCAEAVELKKKLDAAEETIARFKKLDDCQTEAIDAAEERDGVGLQSGGCRRIR